MKFTVKQSNFTKGLNIVNKAVNPRTSLPMLSNVLIKTEKGQLKLTASDFVATISVWMGAKIDEQGEYTVPAKLLTDFVGQLTDDTFEAQLIGAQLRLKTAKATANFSGMPGKEFPTIDVQRSAKSIKLDAKKFLDALAKVSFAVATDESRPILTGILLKAQNTTLTLAGTDGFRMAEHKITLESPVTEEIKCVIPGKYFLDVVKSFAATSSELNIYLENDRNTALVWVEDMEAQLRLLEGEYPDYEAIVPSEFTTVIKTTTREIGNAIKLARVLARETGNMIKIVASSDKIEVLSQPNETGNNDSLLIGELDGEDIQIAFNAKYLIEFVNNMGDHEISFNTVEALKPGMLKIEGNNDYYYLVMPMRANW